MIVKYGCFAAVLDLTDPDRAQVKITMHEPYLASDYDENGSVVHWEQDLAAQLRILRDVIIAGAIRDARRARRARA